MCLVCFCYCFNTTKRRKIGARKKNDEERRKMASKRLLYSFLFVSTILNWVLNSIATTSINEYILSNEKNKKEVLDWTPTRFFDLPPINIYTSFN